MEVKAMGEIKAIIKCKDCGCERFDLMLINSDNNPSIVRAKQ